MDESNKGKEELTLTKQQKFDFSYNTINDEESSLKIKNSSSKIKKLKLELLKNIKEKNKYKNLSLIFLLIAILMTIIMVFSLYILISGKNTKIEKVEVREKPIVMLGDSITDYYNLNKYFGAEYFLINSGVAGYKTTDILEHMEKMVYQHKPKKVFLLIGTNDLNPDFNIKNEVVFENIKKIIDGIKENTKNCKVYVESIYPINDTDDDKISHEMVNKRSNDNIKNINNKLKKYAKTERITYIDLYSKLRDDEDNLKLEYTKEGLHMSDEGYEVVTKILKKYMNN